MSTCSLRALVALFGALSILACSSKSDPPSAAPSAFVGAGSPDCPQTDPGAGGACAKADLRCEYGGDFNPACNIIRACGQGNWGTVTFNGVNDPTCPTPTVPTEPPNPAECPASAPRTSDACAAALSCNYADTKCTCENKFWNCSTGKQFCKTPRPRLGTPCNANDECVIQLLGDCDKMVLTCSREGTWTSSKAICL
jgi:hypothetical protein